MNVLEVLPALLGVLDARLPEAKEFSDVLLAEGRAEGKQGGDVRVRGSAGKGVLWVR